MDDNCKLSDWRLNIVALGLNPESIGALRQMGEGKDVYARLKSVKWFAIDTI
jgi:hypothetical protein